jgi:DNA-directed RNA polymerase subunit M/transcription elongation factor TFIIS
MVQKKTICKDKTHSNNNTKMVQSKNKKISQSNSRKSTTTKTIIKPTTKTIIKPTTKTTTKPTTKPTTKSTIKQKKISKNTNTINTIKKNILDDDISKFDIATECTKMFNLRTSASTIIRPDVMIYAIQHLDRKNALFAIANYVPFGIADKIENGIIEFVMIQISSEQPDTIDFLCNMYRTKIRDICLNLDAKNKRINNQTLLPSLLDGGMDAYFVAFMTPQQMHPARWSKELEKRRVAEAADDNKKVTDIYKCRKCGDRKSTTTQMQTRSADEPMTIFVTCLTCYNTFTTQ